jgi:hypothetical protein
LENVAEKNVNVLPADFSILKLDDYLPLEATNKYEDLDIQPKGATKTAYVGSIDRNSVNIHKQPRDILCNEIRI